MQLASLSKVQVAPHLLQRRLLLIACLFVAAFAVRLYQVDAPPLNFHATRQYRSLIIARGFYYAGEASLPDWQREVAALNWQRQGLLEPPLNEFIVSLGYQLWGEELWIPKVLGSVYWLVGAGWLYLIARRIVDAVAALFSTAFYLLLPFAVVASRSFQPDSLMLMLLLASVLAILRYDERPSALRWVGATGLAALTFCVKPMAIFAIAGVFLSLALGRSGMRRTFTQPRVILFVLISLLLTLLFYVYGSLVAGFLRGQAQASFLPRLLFTPFFWRGCLLNIDQVVGWPALIVALFGVMLLRVGQPRTSVMGWWAGYGVFCLVFDYHTATHDYYHLQLVPLVALSLGPVAALVSRRLVEQNRAWPWRVGMALIGLVAVLLCLGSGGLRLSAPSSERYVAAAKAIGEQVNHSTRTVFLSGDYGLPLEYHGDLSGWPWPIASDLEWARLAGYPSLDAEERFKAWFAEESPQYFIVMDMGEFRQQPDLQQFLAKTYPVVAQTPDYLVFDLRRD